MEFLIWIAFLIVYSIIQSQNKKKRAQKGPAELAEGDGQQPSLGDALREIQEAFQQVQATQTKADRATTEPAPPIQLSQKQLPQLTQQKHQPVQEPEFHSLEKRIPDRQLESKTKFSEKVYAGTSLEVSKTYEDSFPERSFYDDNYSHPHMEDAVETLREKSSATPATILRKRLRDKNYLSEAFIIQQILGKPLSKKR